jgi:hypothetical protein
LCEKVGMQKTQLGLLGLFASLAVTAAACSSSDTTPGPSSSSSSSSSSSGGSSSSSSSSSGGSSSGAIDSGTDASDAGSSGDASDGAADPTFTQVFNTVLSGTCNGCHAAGHPTGLDMSSKALAYTNLVGKAAGTGGVGGGSPCATAGGETRVIASNAAGSLLVKKIDHVAGTCGATMPLRGAKIASTKIDLVKAWIAAGAKND